MIKITKELIEEIKLKLDITYLLDHYNVKRGKSNSSYFCPFHEDKNPSFVAKQGGKNWKCLSNSSCGHGDVIHFIKKIENHNTLNQSIEKCIEILNISKTNYIQDNKIKSKNIIDNNIKHSRKKLANIELFNLESSNLEEINNKYKIENQKLKKSIDNSIKLDYIQDNNVKHHLKNSPNINLNSLKLSNLEKNYNELENSKKISKFNGSNSQNNSKKSKIENYKDNDTKIENYKDNDIKHSRKNSPNINLNNLKQSHLDYLQNRGIKTETAQKFNLKGKGDYILFPQQRDKDIVGYKGINIKNKKMYFEGLDTKSKLFPNYDFTDLETIIFTAGEWDCLYLNQELSNIGLNNVKAFTNSTGEGNYPLDLKEALKTKFKGVSIKIIYDNDEQGKSGAEKLAHELHDLNIPIEIYLFSQDKPKGYDISDFLNEGNSVNDLFKLEKILYQPQEKSQLVEIDNLFSLDNFTFKTPNNYNISTNGITKFSFGLRGEKIESVSSLPVIITQQAINTDDDIVSLRLDFKRDGLWKKVNVEREIICDSKKILTLCNCGFPVHAGNAKKMVEYLNDFEFSNMPHMETVYLTHNNGWKEFKGLTAFGLGSNILGLQDINANILFSPEQGFERFNKALHAHGSNDKWLKTIKPLLKNPKIALAVYASLSAPLLSLVDCSSFLLHYWGDSSMGKTTVIEIASSIWGNPSKETGGLVTSWNNTQVFVEKIATFFDDLPIFLDDSHLTDDKTVSNVLYMLGNSTGRGRGTKDGGIKANTSWRTVCFSTGEKQLTESTQYDGARARTIEISGSPFGRNEGKLVNSTKAEIRENYGHLGNIFITALLEELKDPEKLKQLKDDYRGLRDILALQAKNEISDRLAGYFAAIWLAGELAETYLNIDLGVKEIIEICYLETINERKSEGDISTRALNDVISFAQANMKSFMGKSDESTREHFGIWKDAEYIAFYPHKLKDFLGKSGFSYNSILKSWSDRDWIKRSKEGYSYPFYYESNQYRMIVIKWESVFKES